MSAERDAVELCHRQYVVFSAANVAARVLDRMRRVAHVI